MENKQIAAIGGMGLILLLIVLFLFQSSKIPNMDDKPLNWDFNKKQQTATPTTPVVIDLQGQDLKIGTGSAVVAGDTIMVHYIGAFLDGKKFDSSYDRNEPFEITVGADEVIKGFDLGVVGMKVGGKRKLIIPASLAYGEKQAGPIPPNTPIQFEVELLEIKPKVAPTPSPDPAASPSISPTTTPAP